MLFVLVGLCFLLVNASNEYTDALAKCTTYEPLSKEYIDFNGRYNPNLEWDNELSYAACYDLVGLEPNNVNVRYEAQRTFAGKYSGLPLGRKVRLALAAGSGKNKIKSLAPQTIYGCNSLVDGEKLKVLCLYWE
ncbi:hypothetical protein COOONC_11744 [Cooperia oncophora]